LVKTGFSREQGDTLAKTNRLGIKINPYKPFLGLANIGFEYQLYRHFSVSLFAEYVFAEKLIIGKDIEHPVFVFELSPRYYFSEQEPLSGFFAAPVTGFTLKRKDSKEAQGFILGAESGYKFLIGKKSRFFIEPKLILLYNFSATEKFLPGIEGHLGIRL